MIFELNYFQQKPSDYNKKKTKLFEQRYLNLLKIHLQIKKKKII